MTYAISVVGSLSVLLVAVAAAFLVIGLAEWLEDRRHRRRLARQSEEGQ